MTGPLRQVLAAVEAGALTVAEVSRRTGLDPDLVSAAVQHLARAGLLDTVPLTSLCPAQGCGSCLLAGAREPDRSRCRAGDPGPGGRSAPGAISPGAISPLR